MKLYIDSDSILYRSAHINNNKDNCADEALAIATEDDDDLDLETAEDTDIMEAMQHTFHSMVDEIVSEVQIDARAKGYEVDLEPILVITVKDSSIKCENLAPNFRYEVMESVPDENVKDYKHSRRGMEVPDGLVELYDYVFDLPNCICIGGVEADDVVVYYGQNGHIVAALDKDVLGSLEYAYNFGRGEWVEHTKEEIHKFPYYQTLTGDSSDGLRGAYRIGDKKATALLEGLTDPLDMWKVVVRTYFTKEQTLEEAIATYRCVSMTQWTPETGLVYWQPPKKDKK